MTSRVREPIQVYLTPEERGELDRQAQRLGVSRSELLRRGIAAVGRPPLEGPLGELAEAGLLTPPLSPRGEPPRGPPVVTLDALLSELDADREGA